MKAQAAKAGSAHAKCEVYMGHSWDLGNVMGEAAWQRGFDAGRRFFTTPSDGEIRVNLSPAELMKVHWLAHVGFEYLVEHTESTFAFKDLAFKDQKEAEEATHAIEHLEFYIPKTHRDPTDPYALSFNRQTSIWRRWPSEERAT
jgi:hypothetical protein